MAGTERQHVAKDYAKRLNDGIESGIDFIYLSDPDGSLKDAQLVYI